MHQISVEEKRLLRTFRKENNIDDAIHERCALSSILCKRILFFPLISFCAVIQQYGWTEDEYEDGEKVFPHVLGLYLFVPFFFFF